MGRGQVVDWLKKAEINFSPLIAISLRGLVFMRLPHELSSPVMPHPLLGRVPALLEHGHYRAMCSLVPLVKNKNSP